MRYRQQGRRARLPYRSGYGCVVCVHFCGLRPEKEGVRRRMSRTADGHYFQLVRDPVSPHLLEFNRIEHEDRLFDQVQCDTGEAADGVGNSAGNRELRCSPVRADEPQLYYDRRSAV